MQGSPFLGHFALEAMNYILFGSYSVIDLKNVKQVSTFPFKTCNASLTFCEISLFSLVTRAKIGLNFLWPASSWP